MQRSFSLYLNHVVFQKLDSNIYRINHYSGHKYYGNHYCVIGGIEIYPLASIVQKL